jgi:putative Holliday junction resolvase
MALDYGDVRTGVAISDFHGILASPHGALASNGDSFWADLGALIAEYEPIYIAVGLPAHLSGKSGARVELVRQFTAELSRRFNISIVEIDERLTSKMASAQFRETGHKASRKGGDIDAQAAVLILEQALASESGKL